MRLVCRDPKLRLYKGTPEEKHTAQTVLAQVLRTVLNAAPIHSFCH